MKYERFFVDTHTCRTVHLVSPSGRDVAQRQRGLAPSLRELDLPQAKTEGAAGYLSRIRLFLAQTCPRAAPSVTACAVPPSSGRKALVLRTNQTCLSLWERCRAATERAGISYFPSQAYLTRTCQRAALSVICFANASSPKGRAKKPVRAVQWTN